MGGSGGAGGVARGAWIVLSGPCVVPMMLALYGNPARSAAIDAEPGWLSVATALFYAGLWVVASTTVTAAGSTLARAAWLAGWVAALAVVLVVEVAQFGMLALTGTVANADLMIRGAERWSDVLAVLRLLTNPLLALPLAPYCTILALLVLRTRVWRPRREAPLRRHVAVALCGALLMVGPGLAGSADRAIARWPALPFLLGDALIRDVPPAVVPPTTPPVVVERPVAGRPANIVVIILESTSYRATTLGDPALDTTPFLARLAGESLVAERAHTIVPHTTKSSVSILCGYEPRLVMRVTESGPAGLHHPCLPHLLRPFGYDSAFLRSATGVFEGWDQLIRNQGFEHVVVSEDLDPRGWHPVNLFGYEDRILLEPSRRWLEQRDGRPFVAVYLTGTPHFGYDLPESLHVAAFSDDEKRNAYLNSVRYVDAFVEELFGQYRDLGLYDDTIFVIVGDHGEAFGEHGRLQHDGVPWDEVARIPLLVHAPGRAWDRPVVTEGVNQLDILPTVLELAGFELRGGPYGGVPIHRVRSERRLFFRCWYADTCTATLRGGLKFVDHHGLREVELFDRDVDPAERVDLADLHPEVVGTERRAAARWRALVEARYAAHARRPEPLGSLVQAVGPAVVDVGDDRRD